MPAPARNCTCNLGSRFKGKLGIPLTSLPNCAALQPLLLLRPHPPLLCPRFQQPQFHDPSDPRPVEAGHLRNRGLVATAGAIEKAKRIEAKHSILKIHEFVTSRTQANKRIRNHEALNYFTSLLSGRKIHLAENTLMDPINVAYARECEKSFF
jgi:hypothetical protein